MMDHVIVGCTDSTHLTMIQHLIQMSNTGCIDSIVIMTQHLIQMMMMMYGFNSIYYDNVDDSDHV